MRHIARTCVLSGRKPDQDEPRVAGPRLLDLGIDKGKVKFALLWLNQFPTDCAAHRIQASLSQIGFIYSTLDALEL
jgi:hypothetical protein